MNYTYSKHILDRMKERDISEEEILKILFAEVDIYIIPSKKDIKVELILGYVEYKYIALIINKETNNLITVRRMRDNEKKLFKEAKNDKK